jgi:hypothetical protein
MVIYHGGAIITPIVAPKGTAFEAGAKVSYEDGNEKSLGVLGHFASAQAAMRFAITSATAFVDGDPLPRPPVVLVEFSAR